MRDRLIIFEAAARSFYERATQPNQKKIERIVFALLDNPFADDETKFPFDADSLLYRDSEFAVVYQAMVDSYTIVIVNIGAADEPLSEL